MNKISLVYFYSNSYTLKLRLREKKMDLYFSGKVKHYPLNRDYIILSLLHVYEIHSDATTTYRY